MASVIGSALALGCASHGIVHDGTSVSYGPSNAGILLNPAELPVAGDGHRVPERWAKRGLRYGTDEMIALVVHAGREVQRQRPGPRLGVGDLSPFRGGPSAWHRSHQTGRDVDLIYYALDEQGASIELDSMPRFGEDGTATIPGPNGESRVVRFDVERNWLVVRALVDNPIADVQWIFVADWLKQAMLDHAIQRGEPQHVILAASYLLGQPGDSLPHDDHMHVRVYCAPTDRIIGCSDRGSFRWLKRDVKYLVQPATRLVLAPLTKFLRKQPTVGFLALSAVPFPGFVAR